jgi:hypothetical protein
MGALDQKLGVTARNLVNVEAVRTAIAIRTIMRFARIVFIGAGVWGIVALMPLYGLVDLTGRPYSSPIEYPQFFYGFLSVALAWQIAFLVIGTNPARFRALMIPSILEKLGYCGTLLVLYGKARISAIDVQPIVPDLLLGVLFVAAFAKTRPPNTGPGSSRVSG